MNRIITLIIQLNLTIIVLGTVTSEEKNDFLLTHLNEEKLLASEQLYIQFEDTVFKRLLVENTEVNTNSDEEISYDEASEFSGSLILSGSSLPTKITNLKGLECFIHLKALNVVSNNITQIDVNNLKEIEIVHCDSNPIKTINLNNLEKLYCFTCSRCEIDSIFIDSTENLTDLYCEWNDIEKIYGLSNCVKMESLHCEGNNIKSLSLASLDSLKVLTCNRNQLSSLDISNNKNLFTLYCSENSIDSLALNNNQNLIHLKCEDNNLKYLDARGPIFDSEYQYFQTAGNPLLNCISIDNPEWASTNYTFENGNIDENTNFCNNCELTTMNEELNVEAFTISPNPVGESIYLSRDDIFDLSIYNTQGNIQLVSKSDNKVIDTSELPVGIYILRAKTSKGDILNLKFIKDK